MGIKSLNRIHYFDIAKGILILMLMLSHFGSASRRTDIENDWFHILFYLQPFYACFLMQCFFIITGYCSNFNISFSAFFKKQWKQIIIPWISFEIIKKISTAIYYSDYTFTFFIESFLNPPNTELWFFSALLLAKLYLWFMINRKVSHLMIISSGLFLLLISIIINEYNIIPNILAFKNGFAACLYVSFGYILKKRTNVEYQNLLKLSVIIFPLSILAIKFFKLNIPILDVGVCNVGWEYFPIIIIVTITGSLAILYICKLINQCKILEYFGRNSIIIYGIHFIPLMSIIKFYTSIINTTGIPSLLFFIIYDLFYIDNNLNTNY